MRFGIFTLDDWDVSGRTVLCRVDINQPVDRAAGILRSTKRIEACVPTVRELAAQAGVNPNTMQRALSQLESDNLVITNRTAGRTVTEDTEILQKVRRELARHQVQTYLQQMALLGYTSQEAAQLLIQEKEETP